MLLIGLVAGLTNMVRRQEWHDSLVSVQTLIQSQIQDVVSGINLRKDGSSDSCGGTTNAGASGCFAIGRAITFRNDNTGYDVYDVIATKDTDPTDADAVARGDVNGFAKAQMKLSDKLGSESGDFSWGTSFKELKGVQAYDGGATNFFGRTLVIARSPLSGNLIALLFAKKDRGNSLNNSSGALDMNPRTIKNFAIVINSSGLGATNTGVICMRGTTAGGVTFYSQAGTDTAGMEDKCVDR